MDLALQTLLDKQALYELSCRYMRGLDRTDAELLRSIFWLSLIHISEPTSPY